MKILIDLTALADNFSGIERYALNTAKNLIELSAGDNFILVFKNAVHKEFEDLKQHNNIEMVVVKGKNKLIFNQLILPYYLYKIKAEKYLFFAFPSPLLFRKKGIYNTVHDLTAFLYPETMTKHSMLYFKYSIMNAMKVSEEIITVSESSCKDIVKKFGNKNISVVKNGISDVFTRFEYNNEINDLVKKKYKLPSSYIMCLGTLEPRKNLKLLIRAYAELKRKNNIDEKLVLVGRKGWKMDEVLGDMDIKDIQENIIFTGFVDDEHLPYIYMNSELFVFPSIYEGFGIPPIEAMYMKVPVLISNIEVLKEVCGSTVLQFENNSLEDLIKKLNYGLNNETSESILVENHFRAKMFSWKSESKNLLKLLKGEKNE